MEDPLGLGLGAGCITFLSSVFFSLTEGALYDYSWSKFEDIAGKRRNGPGIIGLMDREDDIALAASTLKVVSNLGFVIVATFVSLAMGYPATVSAAVAAVASAFVILAADVPFFMLGRKLSERILVRFLPVLNFSRFVAYPALAAGRVAGEALAGMFGHETDATQAESIADDILSAAAEGKREGFFREEQHDMIEGVIRLRERRITEVMTPRTDMISLPVEMPVDEAVQAALKHGHSRFPVYRDNRDNIVGILHVRELLRYFGADASATFDDQGESGEAAPFPIETLLRTPTFVPETKNIADLFEEMRTTKVQMAVVLDEYGGTSGIITVEDILEEIVGDISDEHETDVKELFRRVDERTAVVDGRMRIDDLNSEFEVSIPDNESYDTVGGYILTVFGRVPAPGETHRTDSLMMTVTDADQRKVLQVQVVKGVAE